jgi:drug/metabolite transporter (DMT)-like permease
VPSWSATRTACASGIIDMGANVLYVLAARRGLLSVVAVLTSLYPAATVVLARYVLQERVGPVQLVGFAVAAIAVTLIALD